jgi:hypothetical protein
MNGGGYEGGNDASVLRCDPMFKIALDLPPSDHELRLQSTNHANDEIGRVISD